MSGPGRLVLLLASPRVAPGLLSRDAWQALTAAETVLCRDAADPLALAVADTGLAPAALDDPDLPVPALARMLLDRATALGPDQSLIWLPGPDGDPGLADALAAQVSVLADPPQIEVITASWDVPGARLLDAVAAMDRLRGPGGCPWDAEQTHESLAPYLLEEAHETVEAIHRGDGAHLADELGDVLLQVLFHARVAAERDPAAGGFDIDTVAGHLVGKLVRRHPHVFGDGDASSPAEVEAAWERIKADERRARGDHAEQGLLDGIPASLPALQTAAKVLARSRRRGIRLPPAPEPDALGARVLALAVEADAAGVDLEAELRATLRAVTDQT